MKKNIIILGLIITMVSISCNDQIETQIITIDTHNDINVANFTDYLNYTMNTDSQLNIQNIINNKLWYEIKSKNNFIFKNWFEIPT